MREGGKQGRGAMRLLVSAGAGLVALLVLAWWVDLPAAGRALGRAGIAGAGSMGLLCAAALGLHAAAWHLLLRAQGVRTGAATTGASFLMGNAVAWATPSLYLGGEPIRIWHIARVSGSLKRDVAATVVVHKFAEFAGFLTAFLVCAGAMVWSFDLPPALKWSAVGLSGVLLLAFLVLAGALLRRWPLVSGLIRRAGPRWAGARDAARDMEERIGETMRERRGAFFGCLALAGAPIVLVAAKPLVFFACLGRTLSFPEVALLFVLTQLVLALQFTPGGLGVFEGGVIGAFALIGIGGAEAMAYAAAQRIADAVLVGGGVALAIRGGAGAFLRGGPDPSPPSGP